eukprot:6889452-Pyramimonas_sp.AAC.1
MASSATRMGPCLELARSCLHPGSGGAQLHGASGQIQGVPLLWGDLEGVQALGQDREVPVGGGDLLGASRRSQAPRGKDRQGALRGQHLGKQLLRAAFLVGAALASLAPG